MSAGCSLDDAFPAFPDGVKSPKKKRSTKGPALAFLKGVDSDPDRPFVATIPKESQNFPNKEGFAMKDDPTVDIIGVPGVQAPAAGVDSYGHTVSSYFGKSETDESLSNFSPSVNDKTGYTLHSSFPAKLSVAPGLDTAAGSSLPLSANANNAWKPLTTAGQETAFFKEKTAPFDFGLGLGQNQDQDPQPNDLRQDHAMLRRQIDTLFARLESMEHRRSEFSHSELGLFILTGLFIMFGLDTVRRLR
jgi:hypothetical protein